MKTKQNALNDALSSLSAIKLPKKSESASAENSQKIEQIFPEPKGERVTIHLFAEDLKNIDKVLDAAKATGRRKINQSQAIRVLIRTGEFRPDTFDRVLAEDGRRTLK